MNRQPGCTREASHDLVERAGQTRHAKVRYVLAATAVGFVANAQPALAAQVQAYVIVDVAAASTASAAAEKLRSTSLGNCLQLILGSHARTVVLHLACDEDDRADTRFLSQALVELSRVDGVARATIVSVRRGND
jgi:hypothetical protein